jgi:hypothetical protein
VRRLLRIPLKIATVLSLVLCLATCVLWVRSYWYGELLQRVRNAHDEEFTWQYRRPVWVYCGGLRIEANQYRSSTYWSRRANANFEDDYKPGTSYYRRVFSAADPVWKYPAIAGETDHPPDAAIDGGHLKWSTFLGFKWGWGYQDGERMHPSNHDWKTWTQVVIPLWFIALLPALLPAARLGPALKRRRLRRAKAEGSCARCGYDLRVTRERCPECGTPTTVRASKPPSTNHFNTI